MGAACTPGRPCTSGASLGVRTRPAADASACLSQKLEHMLSLSKEQFLSRDFSVLGRRSSFHRAFHVAAQGTAGFQQHGTGGVRAVRGFALSPAHGPHGVGDRERGPGPARQDRDGMEGRMSIFAFELKYTYFRTRS